MRRLLTVSLIAVMGIGLEVGVLKSGIARNHASIGAAIAAAVSPEDARAVAGIANSLISADASADDRRRASALAVRSLRRDPTLADSARNIGLLSAMRTGSAPPVRALDYAQRLSRRDLPTQLWWIEHNVTKGSVVGALRHFDIALRSSPVAGKALVPVLIRALEDPTLIEPIAALIATKPPWATGYLLTLAQTPGSNTNLASLFNALARRGTPIEPVVIDNVVRRLVDAGQVADAASIDAHYRGVRPGTLLRNGSFEHPISNRLFDWQVGDAGGITAAVDANDSDTALHFSVTEGDRGLIVKQMLALPPGRYRLHGMGSTTLRGADVLPNLTVQCVGAAVEQKQGSVALPTAATLTPIAVDFIVPASGCTGQTLTLTAAELSASSDYEGRITRLSIQPR